MHPRAHSCVRAALALAMPAVVLTTVTQSGPVAAAVTTSSASKGRPASTVSLQVPVLPPAQRAASGAGGTTGRHLVAGLSSTHIRGFAMVGVTWDEGTGSGGTKVRVRTERHGTWSGWSTLDVDEDGPESTRAGTEPLWVDTADGVAVRVLSAAGVAPRGVKVVLVDDGTDPARSGGSTRSTAAGSPAYTAQPSMITRASWGARHNAYCDSPRYGSHTLGVIFHHTAGSNRYSKGQSRGIVRGTQAYHMKGRGWCDIGYNFLVDKYGQVFEGRSGGALRQVRGAHAGNYAVNTYDMGVSMMGNLDTTRPSAAMKRATVHLIGWRLGTNYLPAKGTYRIAGHRLNRIAGHRDVHNAGIHPSTATACPGRYGYAWLRARGGLRDRVAAYVKHYRSPIKTRSAQLGRTATGYVSVGEYRTEGGRKTRFTKGDMYSKGSLGAHFVSGTVKTEYAVWGIQHGPLGFPTGDLVTVTAGQQAYQRFQHGTVYRVRANGGTKPAPNKAFGLTSGVDTEYQRLGGFESQLGAPTSRVRTTDGVDSATFEHGRIDYDRDTGVATVSYTGTTPAPTTGP